MAQIGNVSSPILIPCPLKQPAGMLKHLWLGVAKRTRKASPTPPDCAAITECLSEELPWMVHRQNFGGGWKVVVHGCRPNTV
jgi:hypothetical protein